MVLQLLVQILKKKNIKVIEISNLCQVITVIDRRTNMPDTCCKKFT